MSMKIGTYNLLRGGAALTHWSRVIGELGVDLLLVQESFAPARHEKPLLNFYCAANSIWTAVPGRNWGSGVYARQGLLSEVRLPGFEGWCIAARLTETPWDFAQHPLLVVSIHAPSVSGIAYSTLVNRILDEIRLVQDGCELVIGGDFNLTISKRHASESRKLAAADRLLQQRLQDEFGLMNCWQTANPSQPLAQTLRWQKSPTVPYHCDGIFVPRSWRQQLVACEILADESWRNLSDHNPVIASFSNTT